MTPRVRLALAIATTAAIAGIFWFVAIAPKREQASKLTAEVTQAQARRDAAISKADTAEKAKAHYATDYATVARLGKALPQKADMPSLVVQLESAARAAKVDFRKVDVTDTQAVAPGTTTTTTTSGITPTPLTFTFEGSFFSLNRLLHEVGRFSQVKGSKVSVSGRLLTLDEVKLSAGRKGLPSVKAEITANAYVAPLPSALPGQSAPQTPSTSTTAPAATTAPASQVTP